MRRACRITGCFSSISNKEHLVLKESQAEQDFQCVGWKGSRRAEYFLHERSKRGSARQCGTLKLPEGIMFLSTAFGLKFIPSDASCTRLSIAYSLSRSQGWFSTTLLLKGMGSNDVGSIRSDSSAWWFESLGHGSTFADPSWLSVKLSKQGG